MADLYEVLDVEQGASPEDIKRAAARIVVLESASEAIARVPSPTAPGRTCGT